MLAALLDARHIARVHAAARCSLLGPIIGLTYGLLAVGLVLVYRTNRIINFAHGQIGAFGAAFFGIAVVQLAHPVLARLRRSRSRSAARRRRAGRGRPSSAGCATRRGS